MNYHALAPMKYKKSVVMGFVYRIYRACSSWQLFHTSLEEAKSILINNQYPPSFFEPLIHKSLTDIINNKKKEDAKNEDDKKEPYMLFLNYRGKCSENFAKQLHKTCNNPDQPLNEQVKVIFTLRKLKSTLPQLKPSIPKMFRSGNVYQIKCRGCDSFYVGQSVRHLQTRFREHINNKGPIKSHLNKNEKCKKTIEDEDDIIILGSAKKSEQHLLTLEAIFIRELKPDLNTKDEFKRKTLVIKI